MRDRRTSELLDLVFSDRHQWVTRPPDHWRCHSCDSDCTPRDLAAASIRWSPFRRRIVWHPHEWRHDFQALGLGVADRHRLESAVREHLPGPGRAVTWSPEHQRFRTVGGRPLDWRKVYGP